MLIKGILLSRLMRRPVTVLFDVSGVLIDDLLAVWKADSEAYETCGFGEVGSLEEFKAQFRLPIVEYHRTMGVPDQMMPKLEREYRRAYPKHSRNIRVFPEVKEALKRLKEKEVVLAVVSNMLSLFLREHLQRFGLEVYFEAVTSQDDCTEQKPSPQPILITLEKLGSEPTRSAYVGDMEEDIIAGRMAGVRTVAVCRDESYHPEWRLRRQNPDFLIRNLDSLVTIVDELTSSRSNQNYR